jgi:hypothetical protein
VQLYAPDDWRENARNMLSHTKSQVINLWNCCILLVEVFKSNYLNSCIISSNLALDGVDDQRHALATLLQLREPVPILQKAGDWVGLGVGLDE